MLQPDSSTAGDLVIDELVFTRSIAVIGAGGHGREIADVVRAIAASAGDISLAGIADDGNPDRNLLRRSRTPFLGTTDDVLRQDALDIVIGIGAPGVRQRIDRRLAPGRTAAAIVHPTAQVGSAARLSAGVVVAQGAILTTNVHLGRHSHVNVAATIAHDCRIGDYVTICPGVRITGDVTVGDGAFIGAAATVLPGVRIGAGACVGAGAVVCRDVPAATTVAGVPAR